MARNEQFIVYLDTHIVVWLYAGLVEKITKSAKKAIDDCDVFISQMVRLELEYLYEIGRVKVRPATIVKSLSKALNLRVSDVPFNQIIEQALRIKWTRDVFDRLLVAEAAAKECSFISADENIRSNFKRTVW
jgi:PIN domain nuclease of toxin-antitoxin system